MMKKLTYIFFLMTMVMLNSCREEIISPDAEIIIENQPLKTASNRTYSVLINANKITTNLNDNLFLNLRSFRVYLSVIDYKEGYVSIRVFNNKKVLVYNQTTDSNVPGKVNKYENSIPDKIEMHFTNFTGKLEIEITSL